MQIRLKYGCNPHQAHATLSAPSGHDALQFLNGNPSYINVMDGLRGWALVRELSRTTGLPAAASFKHNNPAGAAVAGTLTETFRRAHLLRVGEYSPLPPLTRGRVTAID